jgi:hypothetical protein
LIQRASNVEPGRSVCPEKATIGARISMPRKDETRAAEVRMTGRPTHRAASETVIFAAAAGFYGAHPMSATAVGPANAVLR